MNHRLTYAALTLALNGIALGYVVFEFVDAGQVITRYALVYAAAVSAGIAMGRRSYNRAALVGAMLVLWATLFIAFGLQVQATTMGIAIIALVFLALGCGGSIVWRETERYESRSRYGIRFGLVVGLPAVAFVAGVALSVKEGFYGRLPGVVAWLATLTFLILELRQHRRRWTVIVAAMLAFASVSLILCGGVFGYGALVMTIAYCLGGISLAVIMVAETRHRLS